jgi:hypothetical protein
LEAVYLPLSLKKIDKNFLKQEGVTLYYAGSEAEWRSLGVNAKALAETGSVIFDTPLPAWAEK